MSVFNDQLKIRIGDAEVVLEGESGPVKATWSLSIDGQVADTKKLLAGEFTLSGTLPDESIVTAHVRQGALGATELAIEHLGETVAQTSGYVA